MESLPTAHALGSLMSTLAWRLVGGYPQPLRLFTVGADDFRKDVFCLLQIVMTGVRCQNVMLDNCNVARDVCVKQGIDKAKADTRQERRSAAALTAEEG